MAIDIRSVSKCCNSSLSFGASLANAPVNGQDNDTFKVTDTGDATGVVISAHVYDAESDTWINCEMPDVLRVTTALTAGNNAIAHNFGKSPVEVEVRNSATGALISARVVAETANIATIFVPVAVASARITLDA